MGQLGRGNTAGQIYAPLAVSSAQAFTAIVAGSACSFALDSAGGVWGWGSMTASTTPTSQAFGVSPTQLPGISAVEISLKASHVCTRTAAGQVYCFGQNTNGELGRGTASTYEGQPQLVQGF